MSIEIETLERLKRKANIFNAEVEDAIKNIKLHYDAIHAENEILKTEINALKQYVDLMDE